MGPGPSLASRPNGCPSEAERVVAPLSRTSVRIPRVASHADKIVD